MGARLAEALGRPESHGNNGWTRRCGQDRSRRVLERLRVYGLLNRQVVIGTMLARGLGGRALRRLGVRLVEVEGSTARWDQQP